jgi:Ca-activated chloride channel family protein
MGASITTIGVDLAYDERIMSALARDSNGGHFFVADATGLPRIFDQEMDTLTRTIANQAEVTIDLAPGVFAEEVYDRVTVARGSQVVVPLGAFAAGEKKTVLVRLGVPRGAAGERPVAAVRLHYDDLVESRPGDCEGELAVRLSDDPSQLTPLDGVVSGRVSGSETAAALTEANDLVREGKPREARERLIAGKKTVAQRRARAAADCRSNAAACPDEDAEAKFDKAEQVLEKAGGGFGDDTKPASAPEPATQTRENAKDAFDMSN